MVMLSSTYDSPWVFPQILYVYFTGRSYDFHNASEATLKDLVKSSDTEPQEGTRNVPILVMICSYSRQHPCVISNYWLRYGLSKISYVSTKNYWQSHNKTESSTGVFMGHTVLGKRLPVSWSLDDVSISHNIYTRFSCVLLVFCSGHIPCNIIFTKVLNSWSFSAANFSTFSNFLYNLFNDFKYFLKCIIYEIYMIHWWCSYGMEVFFSKSLFAIFAQVIHCVHHIFYTYISTPITESRHHPSHGATSRT